MCTARNAARRTSPKSARVRTVAMVGGRMAVARVCAAGRAAAVAGAACTAVRAAEVGSALQRERGRAVVGAADAMRVPLRRAAAPNAQSQCAGALCRVLGVVPFRVLAPQARVYVH